MFNFDEINGYKVLRSDNLGKNDGVNVFFTTRGCPFPKGKDITVTSEKGKKRTLSESPYFEKPLKIVTAEQTHSDHIQSADDRTEYKDTDALIVTDYRLFELQHIKDTRDYFKTLLKLINIQVLII